MSPKRQRITANMDVPKKINLLLYDRWFFVFKSRLTYTFNQNLEFLNFSLNTLKMSFAYDFVHTFVHIYIQHTT